MKAHLLGTGSGLVSLDVRSRSDFSPPYKPHFRERAGETGRTTGLMPHWLRAARQERGRHRSKEIGLGMAGREGEPHAACRLDHAGGDFQQAQPYCRELSLRQIARFGNRIAHREHQPVGSGVEYEPNLIGDGGTTGRAIGRQLRLVQLDQVLLLRLFSACPRAQ